jgi:hypothetical protein
VKLHKIEKQIYNRPIIETKQIIFCYYLYVIYYEKQLALTIDNAIFLCISCLCHSAGPDNIYELQIDSYHKTKDQYIN